MNTKRVPNNDEAIAHKLAKRFRGCSTTTDDGNAHITVPDRRDPAPVWAAVQCDAELLEMETELDLTPNPTKRRKYMKNKYRNLWHKVLNTPKPEFYENEARKIGEHRGVSVFKLFEHGFDFVFNGACITQRAGATEFKRTIDEILDGITPVSDEVATHLKQCGFNALTYAQAA